MQAMAPKTTALRAIACPPILMADLLTLTLIISQNRPVQCQEKNFDTMVYNETTSRVA